MFLIKSKKISLVSCRLGKLSGIFSVASVFYAYGPIGAGKKYSAGNKGQVSLLITFIIMTLLVAAALYSTSSAIKNFDVAQFTSESSKAFYGAEGGIEVFIYEKNKGSPLLAIDGYAASDTLVCGCITNNNTFKKVIASGSSAVCNAGGGVNDCDMSNMHFIVEKVSDSDNSRVKSTGGYQDIERAVRIQW